MKRKSIKTNIINKMIVSLDSFKIFDQSTLKIVLSSPIIVQQIVNRFSYHGMGLILISALV